MMSQPDQQTITIHILPSISRSKGNQILKFLQVIEDNKTNIVLQTSIVQKSSLVSGNRPGEIFFITYPPAQGECV